MSSLWKEIKSGSNKVKSAKSVNGKTKDEDIAHLFSDKMLRVQDDAHNCEETDFLLRLKDAWKCKRKVYVKMSVERLKIIIKKLNFGVGHDGIHSVFFVVVFFFNMVMWSSYQI